MKKIFCIIAALMMALSLCSCAAKSSQDSVNIVVLPKEEEPVEENINQLTGQKSRDGIYVFYTNDVHCGVNKNTGYNALRLLEDVTNKTNVGALFVDAGDHIQGDIIGSLSKGEYIIDIMNECGYDLATFGNHEFDYGIDRLAELTEMADFPYICCNLTLADGTPLCEPYKIFDINGYRIGFIGVTTPETITMANPKYMKDENGEYIVDFCQDMTGDKLAACIQKNVDEVRAQNVDVVILLAHLGVDATSSPYTSSEIIPKLSGVDAVIDGHSHTVMEREDVTDKDGKKVIVTQTGTELANLGCMYIGPDNDITVTLLNDKNMHTILSDYDKLVKETTSQVVAKTDVELTVNYDGLLDIDGNPLRRVRIDETNLGDLCADAIRKAGDTDIAIINGGGIRNGIGIGDISIANIISVFPFNNLLTSVKTKGSVIQDALELSVYGSPEEFGGFLQVSGMSFDIDNSIPTPVKLDENGNFESIDGPRRVSNIMIGDKPLDPEEYYTLTTIDYIVQAYGNGYTMFMNDTEVIRDKFMNDADALISYFVYECEGNVGKMYPNSEGEGRINYINQ